MKAMRVKTYPEVTWQDIPERWELLPGFPEYAVSNHGAVQNIHFGRPLRVTKNNYNQARIGLVDETGRQRGMSVARLVAMNFLPKPHNQHFNTAIHLDGDKMNCHVSNLAWRPRWFAMKYHRQFEYLEFHEALPYLELVQTGERYDCFWMPSIQYGLIYVDIIKSAVEEARGTQVFPTGHNFRFLG